MSCADVIDPLSITPLKLRALRGLERGTPVRRRSDGVPGHASSARGGISSQASGRAHASTYGATGSHDNNAGINADLDVDILVSLPELLSDSVHSRAKLK